MKSFSEYYKEKEIEEFSQWLESQGYDPQTLDLESLLEAGAWEKAKKWGKGAALAGALGAATLGIMPHQNNNNLNLKHNKLKMGFRLMETLSQSASPPKIRNTVKPKLMTCLLNI